MGGGGGGRHPEVDELLHVGPHLVVEIRPLAPLVDFSDEALHREERFLLVPREEHL